MLETQLVEEGVTPQLTHENNFNLIFAFLIISIAVEGQYLPHFQLGNSPSLSMARINVLPFLTNAVLLR